ncbi:MAG: hypothetical protein WEG56_05525 [Chloroflexota bacterium]
MRRSLGTVLAGVLVIGAAVAVGYAAGDDSHSPTHGLDRSQMAQMMMSGSMQRRVGDHVQMLDDLRSQMTPEMREQLDADDLWQMIEDGDLGDMMDELGHMMDQMPGMGGDDRHGQGGMR